MAEKHVGGKAERRADQNLSKLMFTAGRADELS